MDGLAKQDLLGLPGKPSSLSMVSNIDVVLITCDIVIRQDEVMPCLLCILS